MTIHVASLSLLGILSATVWAAPADRLPSPKPEPCILLDPDAEIEEGEVAQSVGLSYADVRVALNGVIQTALYCGQPAGMGEVHLTFDLTVGCDGVVSTTETIETGGAPADYVQCVSDVISKADFPGHDMPDGMVVTYPVDVSW
jgi:hypothetical protein